MSIASTIIIGLSGGAAVGALLSAGIIIAERVSEYRSRQFLRGLLAKNREFHEGFSPKGAVPATFAQFAGAAAASHSADSDGGKATEGSSFPRAVESANPTVNPPGSISTPTRTVPACLVPLLIASGQIRRL